MGLTLIDRSACQLHAKMTKKYATANQCLVLNCKVIKVVGTWL